MHAGEFNFLNLLLTHACTLLKQPDQLGGGNVNAATDRSQTPDPRFQKKALYLSSHLQHYFRSLAILRDIEYQTIQCH